MARSSARSEQLILRVYRQYRLQLPSQDDYSQSSSIGTATLILMHIIKLLNFLAAAGASP